MKQRIAILLILCLIFLTSCSASGMEAAIPEQSEVASFYLDHKDLFDDAIQEIKGVEYDCLITRNDYYSSENSVNIDGLYIQNMKDLGCQSYDADGKIKLVFELTDVKMIDKLQCDGFVICVFSLCLPDKNFDYGFYYISEDKPIYFGDPSLSLTEKENGFTYEKKASFGTKTTYYTERIAENIYYYDIT